MSIKVGDRVRIVSARDQCQQERVNSVGTVLRNDDSTVPLLVKFDGGGPNLWFEESMCAVEPAPARRNPENVLDDVRALVVDSERQRCRITVLEAEVSALRQRATQAEHRLLLETQRADAAVAKLTDGGPPKAKPELIPTAPTGRWEALETTD